MLPVLSGFVTMATVGLLFMGAIFAGGGIANDKDASIMLANGVMYGGFFLAIVTIVLHVWGQAKYNGGESAAVALWMMFGGIPITILGLAAIFIVWPKGKKE